MAKLTVTMFAAIFPLAGFAGGDDCIPKRAPKDNGVPYFAPASPLSGESAKQAKPLASILDEINSSQRNPAGASGKRVAGVVVPGDHEIEQVLGIGGRLGPVGRRADKIVEPQAKRGEPLPVTRVPDDDNSVAPVRILRDEERDEEALAIKGWKPFGETKGAESSKSLVEPR
jgi:hypothetical protein